MQTQQDGAVIVDDLIEHGSPRVGLAGSQEGHVPPGAGGNVSDGNDGPRTRHIPHRNETGTHGAATLSGTERYRVLDVPADILDRLA